MLHGILAHVANHSFCFLEEAVQFHTQVSTRVCTTGAAKLAFGLDAVSPKPGRPMDQAGTAPYVPLKNGTLSSTSLFSPSQRYWIRQWSGVGRRAHSPAHVYQHTNKLGVLFSSVLAMVGVLLMCFVGWLVRVSQKVFPRPKVAHPTPFLPCVWLATSEGTRWSIGKQTNRQRAQPQTPGAPVELHCELPSQLKVPALQRE